MNNSLLRGQAFRWLLFAIVAGIALVSGVAGRQLWRSHLSQERRRLLSTPGVSYVCARLEDDPGTNPIREIDVGPDVSETVFAKLQRAFPEAKVQRGSGGRLPYRFNLLRNAK